MTERERERERERGATSSEDEGWEQTSAAEQQADSPMNLWRRRVHAAPPQQADDHDAARASKLDLDESSGDEPDVMEAPVELEITLEELVIAKDYLDLSETEETRERQV